MFGPKVNKQCDKCGKDKRIKPGKGFGVMCNSGHFLCSKCSEKGIFRSLLGFLNPVEYVKEAFGVDTNKVRKCPICKTKVRAIKKEDMVVA